MRGCCGNSLSQNLSVLPAPSGREPLAHPQALRFSRELFRTAKGPIPEDDFPRPGQILPAPGRNVTAGDKERNRWRAATKRGICRAQRDWGSLLPARPQAAAFSGVENCIFPRLFHTEKRRRPGVENLRPAIPDWRKINRRSGTVCRMQRKSFDFLFYKRQNACIFIQNFPESGCLNYGVYRADPFLLLKTRWKKWKTSRKTRPFLHKSG